VLDASAAIDWLIQSPAGQRIEKRIFSRKETLHAPHLLDIEVTQVLRRLAREGTLSDRRATWPFKICSTFESLGIHTSSFCRASGNSVTTYRSVMQPTSYSPSNWALR
jgi:predicted nucleic acid-binding protein